MQSMVIGMRLTVAEAARQRGVAAVVMTIQRQEQWTDQPDAQRALDKDAADHVHRIADQACAGRIVPAVSRSLWRRHRLPPRAFLSCLSVPPTCPAAHPLDWGYSPSGSRQSA